MHAIFVTGTAGSGKSLLTSRLLESYKNNNAFAIALNLDPGAVNLPYEAAVDVRDYIDINTIMESYALGPNGALIMASDMIATKLDEIQNDVDSINPDYVIVDTPGQLELFAYRASGPFFISNFNCEERAVLFLFDGTLVSSPANFVSIALLSTSIRLRLRAPLVNVLSKTDLMQENVKTVLSWSSNIALLEQAIAGERDNETYLLSMELLKTAVKGGVSLGLLAVSSESMDGMINLEAALGRIFKMGEEIED
ncbi:MAG: ATP/GTP-binding protein [Nitrososphaerales archaeon]